MKLLPLIFLLLIPFVKAQEFEVNVTAEVITTTTTTIPFHVLMANLTLPLLTIVGIIVFIIRNIPPKTHIQLIEIIIAVLIITAVTIVTLL